MTIPENSADAGRPAEPGPETAADPVAPGVEAGESFWVKFRLWVLRIVAVIAAFFLFAIICTAGAGWYTSRPEFCRSCHIMEPYFVSWEESTHKDVSCIKCHFEPGVAEKARGKMLGLVQLAKYVTSTQGPRPAAEIPDTSCLRSGCHETRLLSGRIDFHGIPFDHQPHLEQLRQGKQLRCTSCHSQIVQGSHMTVTTSTCFLCHFKDEFFNEGLGTCTRCHQIPEEDFELGGGVKFHHDLAYEQGLDCANCHGDLIQGNGEVPPERCTVCHNREDDLQRIDDHVFLHQTHVSDHKVDCLACHLTIHHSLDPHKIEHAAGDCKACHPNHHHEQVEMLVGRGSKTLGERLGGMAVARIACPSCHRVEQVSPTGTVLMKATLETCSACHEPEEVERLDVYHAQVQGALENLADAVTKVEQALEAAQLPADRKAAVQSALKDVKADVEFLRAANGIHNLHYASTVTRSVLEQISKICRELGIDEPEVTLPEVAGKDAAKEGTPEGDASEADAAEEGSAEEDAAKKDVSGEDAVEGAPAAEEAGVEETNAEEDTAKEDVPEVTPSADDPVEEARVEQQDAAAEVAVGEE